MKRLTEKNKRFIDYWMETHNATESYIRAYGNNVKQPTMLGSNLLKKAEVAAEIKKRTEQQLTNFNITSDKVLEELIMIAKSDPRKLFNPDGSMRDINTLDEGSAKSISSFECIEKTKVNGDKEVILKIKLWDKLQALEFLGKHFNLIPTNSGGFNLTQANAEKGGVIVIPQIQNMEDWQKIVSAGEQYKDGKRQEFEKILNNDKPEEIIEAEVVSTDPNKKTGTDE